MRITDYPDLLRTKGKEPMPQAWDETNQDWTPAIDSAATLKALREALGAPADATQADPVQEATAIALLKGLLELTAMRATDQTLTQIKTALTDGTQKVALTGNIAELINDGKTGVTLAAGATITAWFYLDVQTARRVTLVAKNQATGAYAKTSIGYRALTLGKRAISSANIMGAEVGAPCVSHTFEVTAPYVSVILKNGSAETQTYDIDAYLWRS